MVSRKIEIDQVKLQESIKIFDLLQKSCIGVSLLGFLIGVVRMFSRLEDPSSIGPSLALALIIVFYSVLLTIMIITPIKYILSKIDRNIEKEKE